MDGSVLEGLARLLEPRGAFADELRAVGFDPQRPELRYTTAVLMAVLDVCARHVYPGLPREEAHRQIGQRFVDHFFQTFLGRVAGTLLRALGLRRFLLQVPKITSMATAGLNVRVEEVGPGELRLFFKGSDMSAGFTAGAIEGAVRAARSELRVAIVRREPWDIEVQVTGTR